VLGFLSPSLAIVALILSAQSFRISQQALKTSEIQLTTSQKSLATSEKSLKIGQRAYLYAKLYADPEAEGDWRFGVELTNTGNTPARVTRVVAHGKGWRSYNKPDEAHLIGAKQSERIDFALNGISTKGIEGGATVPIPEVTVAYSYVDVFGDEHSNDSIKCRFAVEVENGHPHKIFQLNCMSQTNDRFTD